MVHNLYFRNTIGRPMVIILAMALLNISGTPLQVQADMDTAHLSLPNRGSGLERLLGLGVVHPYPYFQRPKYRYPVYDRSGRGYLLYGYGGPETFQYTEFNPVDGHH